ncbi:hypothetical protein K525DRAFT_275075 [Schizophyllum commune Loenen D]|nr:hypothetical protein K525DRAFT_275075 [Schizophyllum commune Loenen D]
MQQRVSRRSVARPDQRRKPAIGASCLPPARTNTPDRSTDALIDVQCVLGDANLVSVTPRPEIRVVYRVSLPLARELRPADDTQPQPGPPSTYRASIPAVAYAPADPSVTNIVNGLLVITVVPLLPMPSARLREGPSQRRPYRPPLHADVVPALPRFDTDARRPPTFPSALNALPATPVGASHAATIFAFDVALLNDAANASNLAQLDALNAFDSALPPSRSRASNVGGNPLDDVADAFNVAQLDALAAAVATLALCVAALVEHRWARHARRYSSLAARQHTGNELDERSPSSAAWAMSGVLLVFKYVLIAGQVCTARARGHYRSTTFKYRSRRRVRGKECRWREHPETYPPPPATPSRATSMAILRPATTYEIRHLRTRALHHLNVFFPITPLFKGWRDLGNRAATFRLHPSLNTHTFQVPNLLPYLLLLVSNASVHHIRRFSSSPQP